jgi:hypothetical protein
MHMFFRAAAASVLFCALSTPVLAQLQVLTYRPVGAAYSPLVDRIVMINGGPNQLHIYDPITKADIVVALPYPPTALAVSADGKHVAIGHSQFFSYVDLSKPAPSVERTVAVAASVNNIAVTNTGYAYFVPPDSGVLRYVNLATGAVTTTTYSAYSAKLTLSADENTLYLSGSSATRYTLVSGVVQGPGTYFYSSLCSSYSAPSMWPLDASRLLCSSGSVTIPSASEYLYRGSTGASIAAAAASSTRNELAIVHTQDSNYYSTSTDTELRLLDSTYLAEKGRIGLPKFQAGANTFSGHGRFAFHNNSASHLFVIEQADLSSGLLNDYGVSTYTLSPSCNAAAFTSSSVTVSHTGGTGSITVSGAASCVWRAVSTAPWITIVRNADSSGASAIEYYAAQNTTAASRTGTISIGNQTFSITQLAATLPPVSAVALPYAVVDAAYNSAADRLVLVSAKPDQLHIYDAITKQETAAVTLDLPPTSVTISSDGVYAAVGHDGWVTRINLNTAAVVNRWPVTMLVEDVALALPTLTRCPDPCTSVSFQ